MIDRIRDGCSDRRGVVVQLEALDTRRNIIRAGNRQLFDSSITVQLLIDFVGGRRNGYTFGCTLAFAIVIDAFAQAKLNDIRNID